jgi:hypothetical protein
MAGPVGCSGVAGVASVVVWWWRWRFRLNEKLGVKIVEGRGGLSDRREDQERHKGTRKSSRFLFVSHMGISTHKSRFKTSSFQRNARKAKVEESGPADKVR